MQRVNTDGFAITRDEGVELTIHHLRLATMFFEATPDDMGLQLREELERSVDHGETHFEACLNFINNITDAYEKLKEND